MDVGFLKVLGFILAVIVILNAFASVDLLATTMWNTHLIPKTGSAIPYIIGFSGIIFFIALIFVFFKFRTMI